MNCGAFSSVEATWQNSFELCSYISTVILLEDSPTMSPTCFLPASVCRLTAIDMFLFVAADWSTLQLVGPWFYSLCSLFKLFIK